MANQWGRDSGFQSGGKKGRRGLTSIAMMLCLIIGAAGGYAAMRYSQPDNGAAIEDASAELAKLNQALAEARQDASEARAGQAESAAQAEDLTAQLARQAAELNAMVENLAASSSAAVPSDDDIAVVEALTRERDALAKENQRLSAKLKELEAELDTLTRSSTATEEHLAADLARLKDEDVPNLTAERDQLQREISVILAEQEKLKAKAEAAEEAHVSDTARIAELEANLAESERELATSQELLQGYRLEMPTSGQPDVSTDTNVAETAAKPVDDAASIRDARQLDAVAQALRTAPGLATLSDADRQLLTDKLVAGECVTTALKSVFERVPILTLRNLIRDLNSDC